MPTDVHLCHCRMCQKATGGLFAALAPVKLANFAWTRGRPAAFASSNITLRDFCPACGTPLSYRYRNGDFIALTIGSLDGPSAVPVRSQHGIESRIDWCHRLDELPAQPTGQPPPDVGPIVSLQHPDHETAEDWSSAQ
jgi:hypothetical protein